MKCMDSDKVLDEFLAAARVRGWSPVTIDQYRRHLLNFLKAVGKSEFEEITPEDLRKYAEELTKIKTDSAFKVFMAPVKSLFRWAYKQDITKENIGEKIDSRRIQEIPLESYVWLNAGEIKKFLDACKSFKQLLTVKFFLKTGIRVGRPVPRREFCGLSWDDFNFDQKIVRVHGKGRGVEGRIRYSHFDSELADLLKEWRDKHRGAMPIYKDPTTVAHLVRKLAKRSGIPKLASTRHPVHALKHTFCTNWVLARRAKNMPEDLRGLSAQVGTKIAALEVYIHIADQFLKSSYDETMRLLEG